MKILLLCLFLASCASTHNLGELSIQDKTYIDQVKNAQSEFTVSNSRVQKMWRRGWKFINKHSSMRIDSSANNYVLTKDPNASVNNGIGYVLTKNKKGGKTKISIRCMYPIIGGLKYTKEVCQANEKYMSHYMQTGELNARFVNSVVEPGYNSRRRL